MLAKCKVVGLWLCFTQWLGFYAIACEELIFMLNCKKQTNIFYYVASQASKRCIVQKATMTSVFFTLCRKKQWQQVYFLCHITRSGDIKGVCFVVSQGREWLAIAICKLSIARSTYMDECIFMSYCKGANNNTMIPPSWGHKGQLWRYGNDGPPHNNQIYCMLIFEMIMSNELISQEAIEDPQFPGGGQTTPKLPHTLANTTKSSTRVTRLSYII